MESNLPKPLLKWVGGKRQLLPELLKHIPDSFGTYHEPFLGGGALFFELHRLGRKGTYLAQLSDVNQELINFYSQVCYNFKPFLTALKMLDEHHLNEADFYSFRKEYRDYTDKARAALFLYFNKTAFNGLMRQNRSGNWNMPWGKYKNPRIYDEPALKAGSDALACAAMLSKGFEETLQLPTKGDLVYCDPPYIPVSRTSSFVGYSKEGFSLGDHKKLASLARELVNKGVTVILSNADTPLTRELYQGFELHEVQARRAINSKVEKRGPVRELIIVGR